MPPTDEWSAFVLQGAHGRLVNLARHSGVPPTAAQNNQKDDDPFAPLLNAMEAINSERCELHDRLIRLEETTSVTPVPQLPQGNDPLGPLLEALESINGELTGVAARLARLEGTVSQVQFPPQAPRLVNSLSAAVTVSAARGRLVRKAVPRA